MAASPVFVATPKITPQSWTNSDSANTKKTICTAGASGSKVVAVLAASTDSSARVFQLFLNRSSTDYLLGSLSVAVTAGSDGSTSTANLLSLIPGVPRDNDGQPYLYLESGDLLKANNVTQVTSAKEIDVTVVFGNF